MNEQWMNNNNEQIVDDDAVYDVAWLITLAKMMSWVLERLRLGWQCHHSCDDNVAKLGEIALATTMSRGLLISRRQYRRDDNNNGNDKWQQKRKNQVERGMTMTMQMVAMMQQSNIERAIEDADDDKATIKLREVIIPMTAATTPTTQ